MHQKKNDIQDFLKDEYFVLWVLQPDAKSDAYWKNWMKKHPSQVKVLKLAREMVSDFQYQHTYQLPKDAYDGMLETLLSELESTCYQEKRKSIWGNQLIRIAASLFLFMMAGFTFWYLSQPKETQFQEPIPWVVKHTDKGEKLTVRLPDGTIVKLNANSILVFPTVFDQTNRYVKLEGEALFEVVEDAKRPFSIMSGEVKTTVLGTSFNVRAYENENQVAVAVISGKVKVKGNSTEEVYRLPNEVSYYTKNESSLSSVQLDVSDLIAWSKNILIFDEDPAQEVWKKLEDWYGVNIIVPNKQIIKGKYSGRYINESLERVLDGISYASEFTYEIQENKNIIIKP